MENGFSKMSTKTRDIMTVKDNLAAVILQFVEFLMKNLSNGEVSSCYVTI